MMGTALETAMGAQVLSQAPLAQRSDSAMLMAIIERAAFNQEFDLDRIEKLLDLKQRWDAREALKDFAAAKVEFKKHAPILVKNKAVNYGQTSYKHATLDEVTSKVSEALARFGFSHAWSMAQEDNKITVTCTLTHVGGHAESVALSSINDGSGGKNSIQAIGSANSYLQRYTLLAVTGLSTSDAPDDDGRATQKETPPPEINPDVWTSLNDAVHEGTDSLAAAWANVSNDTRRLIVTHYAQRWNDLKAAALAAKRA